MVSNGEHLSRSRAGGGSIDPARLDGARAVLEPVVHRTPVHTSRSLDERVGGRLFFKCENLQRTGAFKFRGAYHALSRRLKAARAEGALTFSSGNHGQALALAGRLLNVQVTVIMPTDAPPVKRAAVEGYGGHVVEYDRASQQREAVAAAWRERNGGLMIPPYDDPDIIVGQATAAMELLEQVPTLDRVIAPVGGGGLLAGTALAVKRERAGVAVIGVEPAAADDAARSFRSGRLMSVDEPDTIADGLRTPSLGQHNFAVITRLVSDIVTVEEGAIRSALETVWTRMKLVIEPSAAVPVAALLTGAFETEGETGIILSGGNVDFGMLPSPGDRGAGEDS